MGDVIERAIELFTVAIVAEDFDTAEVAADVAFAYSSTEQVSR